MNHPIIKSIKRSSRKKLWGISEAFHCSITGTCLSLEETRKIIIKAGFLLSKKTSDYEIHGIAVSNSHKKNKISKIIQKTLENKYKREITIFSHIYNKEELHKEWKEHLSNGEIAGAYWAIMTHPISTKEFLSSIFGDVHMLSHINGASKRGNIEEINQLKNDKIKLESKKNIYRKHIKILERQIENLSEPIKTIELQNKKITRYKEQIESLQNGETISKLFEDIILLSNLYETEQYKNEKAEERIKTLEKKILSPEKINKILNKKDESSKNKNLLQKNMIRYYSLKTTTKNAKTVQTQNALAGILKVNVYCM